MKLPQVWQGIIGPNRLFLWNQQVKIPLCFMQKRNSTSIALGTYSNLASIQQPRYVHHTGRRPIRLFHSTIKRPIGIRFSGNLNGKKPFDKQFTIPPLVIILATFGLLSMFFAILPFIFSFFFPLIIVAVAIIQFKKWNRGRLLSQLMQGLQSSTLKVKSSTAQAFGVENFKNIINRTHESQCIHTFLEQLQNTYPQARNLDGRSKDAARLVDFLQNRVMEAIEQDEEGIRTFFLGNDVSKWVKEEYDLKLDSKIPTFRIQANNGNIIMSTSFPLFLVTRHDPNKHLANVILSFLDERKAPEGFLELNKGVDYQMVISIVSVHNLVPRQFIIRTGGWSGQYFTKYDTKQTSDGHTEYTVRTKP